jgi:predicted phosphodiesterase
VPPTLFRAALQRVPWSRLRRPARRLLVVLVALGTAGAAMTAWGSATRDVGPLETRVAVVPSWDGGADVEIPPLGRLSLDTHAGPLGIDATVTGIRPREARALVTGKVTGKAPGRALAARIAADSRAALAAAAARGALVSLAASALVCGLLFRRRHDALLGAGAVAVVLAAGGGVAATTLRTEALTEPRFTGLLAQAPALVGGAQSFDVYAQRIADLTSNVSRVYAAVGRLPAAPDSDATRVLWVSDIHNNPQAFGLMRELVDQFDVAAIFDTGDITDLGSALENRLLAPVGTFDVPYVYVRGNHDSTSVTQAYLEGLPGVVVLDDAEVAQVAGLRLVGTGDPLYRPNKQVATDADAHAAALQLAGERVAEAAEDADEPVHVALVHEPRMAVPLFGVVPLVLDGHVHERRSRTADGTLELTQGSSGGAGLRTLTGEAPLPLQMSILHFDPDDGTLVAVDDVTVGGVGERSVTVERRSAASYLERSEEPDLDPGPTSEPTSEPGDGGTAAPRR